mmetsp:Transcript_31371/g.62168  ORF Transcript_31371/g.62168 Transcript_31371/m.62168 type:complete len:104 (-) Transcript_31371:349-660(-)
MNVTSNEKKGPRPGRNLTTNRNGRQPRNEEMSKPEGVFNYNIQRICTKYMLQRRGASKLSKNSHQTLRQKRDPVQSSSENSALMVSQFPNTLTGVDRQPIRLK